MLASYFNTNINGPLSFLLAPPICQVRQTSGQTLTTSTDTAITFDTEDVDSTGMHSTSSNTSRLTAVYPGWYSAGGGISFAANATGRRGCSWRVNAALLNGSTVAYQAPSSTFAGAARAMRVFLNVGDYLEMYGRQESGGNLATAAVTGDQSNVSALWVSS